MSCLVASTMIVTRASLLAVSPPSKFSLRMWTLQSKGQHKRPACKQSENPAADLEAASWRTRTAEAATGINQLNTIRSRDRSLAQTFSEDGGPTMRTKLTCTRAQGAVEPLVARVSTPLPRGASRTEHTNTAAHHMHVDCCDFLQGFVLHLW